MAVKFKVIERGEPGVVGGGVRKFYASPISNGEMTVDELTDAIKLMSTISGADIRGVLYSLLEVMKAALDKGEIVRLGELGSLRVSFGSEGRDTADEVNVTCIKSNRVLFKPGKEIRKMLKTLEYKKG